MNRYAYFSEQQAVQEEFQAYCDQHGDKLLEYYLANGFDQLAVDMRLGSPFQRELLFDFLMLEKKALLKCMRQNKAFFLKLITDGKGELIRPMLGLKAEKYDGLWREALDLMSLYFAEKKVIEKMTNLELEKFFQSSIFGSENNNDSSHSEENN